MTAVSDRIVGRERELGALRTWLDAIPDGGGRLVLCAGEPGIGKTRLAQELAGMALASGTSVAWGRCVEADGAPAFSPWRQVLRALGVDAAVLAGDPESPQERFRLLDDVTDALGHATAGKGLVVILDDIHWADEPSLRVLRHVADQLSGTQLLVFATFRDVEPAAALPRVLPDLLRSPVVERLHLRGFGLAEVRQQLGDTRADAGAVLDVTGGNPLFVREVARAMADGTWRPDRPPRTVLDIVTARLGRVSPDCRRLVQAAAIVGRDFSVALVSATLGEPVGTCQPLLDEAVAHGLVDQLGGAGEYRFVHALTREAVEASLTTAGRTALHRAAAQAIEARFAGNLSEHFGEIARHWAELAPYGEAATARLWTVRAADEAVRQLAYEEAARLYRAALALDPASLPVRDRCRLLISRGRAAYFAGDLRACIDAAVLAADTAKAAGDAELVAEAALVLEAVPDPAVNAIAKQLCEQALSAPGTHAALRARLLAQRSHLAFYDGDQLATESLSAAALELGRSVDDDRALMEALRARHEACPGPAGRAERLDLANAIITLAQRTGSARAAMWGELWRVAALIESGELAAAKEELGPLQVAVGRVGGPVSAWHHDRVAACVAQTRGQYAEAATIGRRGFDRMRAVEAGPATGAYFALHCALARHVRVAEDAIAFALAPFEPLPRFKTLARLSRAILLLRSGRPDEAAASYQQAGPVDNWSLPAFYELPGYVHAVLVAAELGRLDDLAAILDRLERFRGEHAAGEGVVYLGPVALALGRGAAALGRLDAAVDDLALAAEQADRAGAPGFLAEAGYHLA
ncbi:MAG: AAA family ATPase, partial [Actinomycetota bacterium]|nr:AAA family ATPase [Actinomycetota bacterium]